MRPNALFVSLLSAHICELYRSLFCAYMQIAARGLFTGAGRALDAVHGDAAAEC
jgi:hypothetical protein